MENDETPKTREQAFVEYVLTRAKADTGYAARLRRADNPVTEYYAWDALASFGVDIEKDWQRLPHALIGAALCRAMPERDGSGGLGAILADCFADNRDQGELRMRRVLACDSARELFNILRPLLRLIEARSTGKLSYSLLLRELVAFSGKNRDRIRQRWAMDFYGNLTKDTRQGGDNESAA